MQIWGTSATYTHETTETLYYSHLSNVKIFMMSLQVLINRDFAKKRSFLGAGIRAHYLPIWVSLPGTCISSIGWTYSVSIQKSTLSEMRLESRTFEIVNHRDRPKASLPIKIRPCRTFCSPDVTTQMPKFQHLSNDAEPSTINRRSALLKMKCGTAVAAVRAWFSWE